MLVNEQASVDIVQSISQLSAAQKSVYGGYVVLRQAVRVWDGKRFRFGGFQLKDAAAVTTPHNL